MTWYPPLDVALYTFLFEFLLSGVQYDTFGHYQHNPRDPYFTDPRVQPLVADLQAELSLSAVRPGKDIRPDSDARNVIGRGVFAGAWISFWRSDFRREDSRAGYDAAAPSGAGENWQ